MVIIRIIYGPFNVVFSFYVIVLIHRLSFFFQRRGEREGDRGCSCCYGHGEKSCVGGDTLAHTRLNSGEAPGRRFKCLELFPSLYFSILELLV